MTDSEAALVCQIIRLTSSGMLQWNNVTRSSAHMTDFYQVSYGKNKIEIFWQRDEKPKLFIESYFPYKFVICGGSSGPLYNLLVAVISQISKRQEKTTEKGIDGRKHDLIAASILREISL